ncbi:LysR substrate-binding domain-containing protein [Dongia deserti]|uniref:LysR substrate-binding domain-containing protein n=1 Tax=Dongia deserti TaxID=2268030 RepID=UPI000E64BBE0|nr:LysR substrate-binding domain-containing protein [Dongia deserti]
MAHSLETLPPLDTLRAFEAAARAGSFSAAAAALNLTHGAISRRIARLEGWLGLRVFERRARGIALTPEGQRLFQRTQEAFALIADTSDRWSEPRGPAVVRVNSMPSVCSLWLMPRVARFEAGNPPLRVILLIDQRTVDLADQGVDLAVRCGRGGLPGRISVKLFEEWCFPIAAPDVAKRIGSGAPERLLASPLIHDSDASGWRAWFAAHGLDYRPRPQDRRFEDYNLVLDAAACGLGIALARPPLAQALMASGRLAAVDERTVLNPVSYWLDRPNGTIRPAAATLAQRIAEEAGMGADTLAAFLKSVRK